MPRISWYTYQEGALVGRSSVVAIRRKADVVTHKTFLRKGNSKGETNNLKHSIYTKIPNAQLG